ncbi:MAG: metallopeptidase family protein [Syntrophobacterales bacterium]|jgi:predicted Zn-dependent protease with MMP-like domain|nr:metallopeptidase family protein [Syntrophobacterales bacterium]
MKLSDKEFDRFVEKAIERIPPEIREHLDNMLITVLPKPSRIMLREAETPPGEILLGLFRGTPLTERCSVTAPPLYPDTIFLFQQSLEEMCKTPEELEEEIEITVVHEVAHFMGISEKRLAELGYD